ncbi:MAG TPA: DUF2332 domain-containing protein [Acidimicrobiales bacterium]|nr:DUF2332 domain-containing protein [Acidimicrobiales bacterium]
MALHVPDLEELARRFTSFAEVDCRGYSPLYEHVALEIAADAQLLGLLAEARPGQRRPTLFLAAVNYLGGRPAFDQFHDFCLDNRDALLSIIETRATQTNEVGRSAVLLPMFCRPPEPLALVEVGASAGLNLLFDRYAYDYDGVRLGDGELRLSCASFLVPDRIPTVASRVGVDREPVDVMDDDAVAWLRACIFADQGDRLERLEQAVAVARRGPPTIVAGNANDVLRDVVAAVDPNAHLVVFHTYVVAYFLREERAAFFALLDDLGRTRDLTCISAEAPGVVPDFGLERGSMVALGEVAYRDGEKRATVVGTCHPHGTWLRSAAGQPI